MSSLAYSTGADLVVLYENNNHECGAAWHMGLMTGRVLNLEVLGYKRSDCSDGVLLHEIGHMLGLNHAYWQEPHCGVTFPFALGHMVNGDLDTLMSYSGSSENYNILSNPYLTCGALPCGISEEVDPVNAANAVLALNAVRFQAERLGKPGGVHQNIEAEDGPRVWLIIKKKQRYICGRGRNA